VAYFLDALAARELDVAGVPTSEATAARCRELGIGLLDRPRWSGWTCASTVRTSSTANSMLTKGGGGALLREKVVATLSDRFVVIATTDKLVERLGDTFPCRSRWCRSPSGRSAALTDWGSRWFE
jgi:ribose 5-phosphate isomerase A